MIFFYWIKVIKPFFNYRPGSEGWTGRMGRVFNHGVKGRLFKSKSLVWSIVGGGKNQSIGENVEVNLRRNLVNRLYKSRTTELQRVWGSRVYRSRALFRLQCARRICQGPRYYYLLIRVIHYVIILWRLEIIN